MHRFKREITEESCLWGGAFTGIHDGLLDDAVIRGSSFDQSDLQREVKMHLEPRAEWIQGSLFCSQGQVAGVAVLTSGSIVCEMRE